ncbi:MAG: O-antigen ligase family protein [Planctomycetota bacterium]|nr:O-antigen ligase family protein [Planctomycetota bacterium]MDA1113972.1 O-antigen ligase family protein [Planctomycetota bacterium]
MTTADSPTRIRDFGTVGTVIMAVLCVAAGGGLGYFVYQDGLAGLRNTYTNPLQLLETGSHYLATMVIGLLLVGLTTALAIVNRIWSMDRMILFTTGMLLVADVIPGLSTLLGMLLLGKLFGNILKKGDAHWPLSPTGIAVLLILIAYSTTFLNVESPVSSLANFLPRIPYIVLALFLPIAVNTTRKLEMLVDYFILAALLSLGVELIQGVASAATGQIITFAGEGFETFEAPWGATARLTGLMTHPNRYSNVASTVGIIVLWFALQPKELITRQRRIAMWVIFVLLVIGVLFSWSRSGWMSFGLAAMMVPFFRWPHLSPIFLGVGGFLLFVGLSTGFLEMVYEYVRNLSRSSADFRWHIDQIGLQAFFEHPTIGIGVEGTKDYFNAYELQVHNAPIQVLADLGMVGVVAFGTLLLTVFSTLLRVVTSPLANPRLRSLAMALGISTIVTFVQGFVEVFLWLKFLWTFIAILGCIYVAFLEDSKGDSKEEPALSPRI